MRLPCIHCHKYSSFWINFRTRIIKPFLRYIVGSAINIKEILIRHYLSMVYYLLHNS